jgi:hypothetical protein
MKYMLLIYGAETPESTKAGPTDMTPAYAAYVEGMQKAGVIVGGERLGPAKSASTVRGANGSTKVLNGPYAETREQLGGYFMIDVPDLDAALAWAGRCPGAASGVIEVRPIVAM